MQIDRRPPIFNFVLVAVLLAVLGGGERASAQCAAADISDNGVVDTEDLTLLLVVWGTNNADADINGDGVVEGDDLGHSLWHGVRALLFHRGQRSSRLPQIHRWSPT